MDEKPACRLVTTGGLAPGPAQALNAVAESLRAARRAGTRARLDDNHVASVATFVRETNKRNSSKSKDGQGATEKLPDLEENERATRFLSGLTLQYSQPARTYIGYAAPEMYVRPVLIRLGSSAPADSVWEAVLALFRARMRAAGPRPSGALPDVLSIRTATAPITPAERESKLANRIVTMGDIDVAIRTAVAYPDGYRPLKRLPRTTRLAVKMSVGGCSDNSIERAEQLRLDYQEYWRERAIDEVTARVEQDRTRRLLLRLSDAATDAARIPNAPWGPNLWEEIQTRLAGIPADTLPVGIDEDLLLGGIADLANRCQVWFSSSFDVENEIARARVRRGVA